VAKFLPRDDMLARYMLWARVCKVTGSHVHFISGNISETVLDRDVVTRVH